MSDVRAAHDVAFKRELLRSVAPRITAQQQMASQPKVSTVGVHFDDASIPGTARMADMLNSPFSDGITIKQSWFQTMPKRFALSMHWPLNVPNYNRPRQEDGRGQGGSLVYYRTLHDLHRESSSDWSARFNIPENRLPGELLFRVTCERPCWTTVSRRYEAPIKVALGTDGVSELDGLHKRLV